MGLIYEDFLAWADPHGRTDPVVEVVLVPCLLRFCPFGRQLDELPRALEDIYLLLLCRCRSSVWKVVVYVQRGVPRGPCEG